MVKGVKLQSVELSRFCTFVNVKSFDNEKHIT